MCYWMLFKRPSRFACFKQASPFPTLTLSPLNQQRRRGHICCSCADTKLPITTGKLAHYSAEIEGLWLPTTIFQHCTVVSSLVINNIKMFQRDNILRYINCAFEVDCMICVRSWQSVFRPINRSIYWQIVPKGVCSGVFQVHLDIYFSPLSRGGESYHLEQASLIRSCLVR